MFHLIHCIIEDDSTRQAFLNRYDIDSDRLEVENRNSVEKRPETVWEMVSNHWNDPLFNPRTESLTIHSDFTAEIDIGFDSVANLSSATPEKCESRSNSTTLDLK